MGQTLSHGVYLPNEGERNCYAGLASNWQILNTAVGAIAEKAPLVHTHTVSQITDFPAYGTTAGTICAGNDSRLSDARTPVAHTHTKSDVTDLFNSANTWTASNTYSNGQLRIKAISQEIGVIPTSDRVQFVSFNGKNDEQIGIIGVWYYNSGRTEMKLYVSDKYKDGVKDPTGTKTTETLSFGMASDGNKFFAFEGKLRTSLYPFTTNFYNIGSSDNQWNNLYAKNYYYNGTAWGLDKENVWTTNQIISSSSNKSFTIKNTAYTLGETTPSANKIIGSLAFKDFNNENAAYIDIGHYVSGEIYSRWLARYKFANGVKSTTGATVNAAVDLGLTNSGDCFFRPYPNGSLELGDSTHKWKSLNGINPGALSLPSDNYSTANLDPTNWNTTGSENTYTAPSDGWLGVQVQSADALDLSGQYVFIGRTTGGTNFYSQSVLSHIVGTWISGKLTGCVLIPVISGKTYAIRIKIGKTQQEGSIIYARFYTCLGNV